MINTSQLDFLRGSTLEISHMQSHVASLGIDEKYMLLSFKYEKGIQRKEYAEEFQINNTSSVMQLPGLSALHSQILQTQRLIQFFTFAVEGKYYLHGWNIKKGSTLETSATLLPDQALRCVNFSKPFFSDNIIVLF